MRVTRLTIERFRGIKSAVLHFDGHSLLLGTNNVGKSTICEALDLVLGPDRLYRFPPVEEFDFYNGEYLREDGKTALPARVEVVLTDLTSELELACPGHFELWHTSEQRLLGEGEADEANPPGVERCLRLETVARYDPDEDQFQADTFFSHGTSNFDDSPERLGKRKRLFGFLYLRALRTGSRALSLERGSLLDVILRMKEIRTGLWEQSIKRLRSLDPPIAADASELAAVLDSIEKRLAQYIPIQAQGRATHLFVSQLTREHLRKTIAFFLSLTPDQRPVPFQEVGAGTLSILVLALLSFIAEVKKDNVIFAMEEPEIALPPHTQRRVAQYLLTETTQCFVTSHSPYVIEQFSAEQILVLRRDPIATVTATRVGSASTLKPKMYRRHARRGLAECMLGPAVIVAEGITEQAALLATAEKLESADRSCYPLDLSGVTIFPVEGDGSMPMFGAFFKTLGIRAYAFYDKKKRTPSEAQGFIDSFDVPVETQYPSMERLLATEVPLDRQWQFLDDLRQAGEQGQLGVPATRPGDAQIRTLSEQALKSNKGNAYAGRLIEYCDVTELPSTIITFLTSVYTQFPKPAAIEPVASVTGPPPGVPQSEHDPSDQA